jgi:FkbM family methyltransferase
MTEERELYHLLKPSRLTAIVDVGAGDIGERQSYQPLLDRGIATLAGFEPQPDMFAKLAARRGAAVTFYPYAVGDGETHTLYACAHAPMSSFLKPDRRQLNQFLPMSQWGQVVAETPLATRRLDDIDEIKAIDFLKIDVQGFELTVLRHGRSKLAQAVAIQAEVAFIATYENQPTLGDIDLELRAQGFVPHTFAEVVTRMLAPMAPPPGTWRGINQIHEADAIYVRDFARAEDWSDEQLKHMALLAHHCFRSFDLAYRVLYMLADRKLLSPDALPRYLELVRAVGRSAANR